jgi:MinD superfamily P-loop ATPase
MRQLVIISGKGGTGKTSVSASFAALAESRVAADCDVDAADLHLVTRGEAVHRESFSGGMRASVEIDLCQKCGKCAKLCRFDAVTRGAEGAFAVDPAACEGCGVCAWFCPAKAVRMAPAPTGEIFITNTANGPLVHARLGIAEENSGKLVSAVREKAKALAEEQNRELVIIDGPPGTGCPVIASLTGADLALIVTEPTLSGLHDLRRAAELTAHFGIKTAVCVNKWDINPELTADIESAARRNGLTVAGRIRHDNSVTEAQIKGVSVVELAGSAAAEDIRALWENVSSSLPRMLKYYGIEAAPPDFNSN